MRRIVLIPASLVLVTGVLLPAVLFSTAPGARWLAGLVEARLPFTLSGIEGSVLRGLRVRRLVYGAAVADGALRIEAGNLDLRLDAACLLGSELCLRELQAAGLRIHLPPPRDDADDDPLSFLDGLPGIRVAALNVGRLELTSGDSAQVITAIASSGSLDARGIRLTRFEACHARACLDGELSLDRSGKWQMRAAVAAGEAPLADRGLRLPKRYQLDARGDFTRLTATVASPDQPALALRAQITFAPAQARAGEVVLDGLASVAPMLMEQPWLQLAGPLTVRARGQPGGLMLQLNQRLSGYDDGPLDLAATLAQDGENWRLDGATLGNTAAPRLRAAGNLGALSSLTPSLQLAFARFRAPTGLDLPLPEISGNAAVSLSLADPLSSWTLHTPGLFLRENDRLWRLSGELRAVDQSLLPVGSIDATLRDAAITVGEALPLRYRRGSADTPALISAPDGLTAAGLTLSGLRVEVTHGAGTRLRIVTEGDLRTELALALHETAAGVAATVEPFTVEYAGQTIHSGGAVDVDWLRAQSAFVTGALCVQWQGSRGCSDGFRLEETGGIELRLELNETYRGQVNDSPYSISARGGGELRARWRRWQLSETGLDLDLSEFILDPFVGARSAAPVRWDGARITGRLAGDSLALDARLMSERMGNLSLSLAEDAGTLSGTLRSDGLAVEALSDLVPEWSVRSGRIVADLRLAGSRERPELYGDLILDDGSMRINAIDADLEDVTFEAGFEGRAAAVAARGVLGGGELRAEGRCCEDGRFTAILIGDRNRLVLPLGLDASFSPSLDIVLGARQLAVTGSLAVHEGVFERSGLEEGGIAVSDDVRRLDAPVPPPGRFRVDLDVSTLIEPGFILRSKQIESTLGGDLRLVMPADAPPSLFGNLSVLAGELRAYGTVLRLTEGSLGFVGDPLNPDLSINAERDIRADNQRVGFRVRGSLEEPVLELFSDPQLTDNETISYLIRGRAPDVGVAADGTAMAVSLGATALNQSGVLAPLNSIPGLSGVTVGAEGSDEDMAATISAYVGNRLYLSYGVGIYEPINALTARLYLRSRLWLQVVSRLENSFDLYYRFDLN